METVGRTANCPSGGVDGESSIRERRAACLANRADVAIEPSSRKRLRHCRPVENCEYNDKDGGSTKEAMAEVHSSSRRGFGPSELVLLRDLVTSRSTASR